MSSQTNTQKRTRVDYIDLAKCIAIFLVVWGHTFPNDVLTSANPPILAKILYSIHMPLFFFLSGLCVSRKTLHQQNGWLYFTHKTILTTGVPYLVWALIYSAFSYAIVPWIFYGSWAALGKAQTLTSLWFLSCLFLSKFAVEGVKQVLIEKTTLPLNRACLFIGLVLIVIGPLLPAISIGYPLCADVAFVATGCMLLGFASREFFDIIRTKSIWYSLIAFLISVALYILCVVLRKDGNFTLMLMANGTYGEPVWAFLCALFGGYSVMVLALICGKLADRYLPEGSGRPLIYIGQHTIGILLIHKPLLQQVLLPFMTRLCGGFMSSGTIGFLSAIEALIISLGIGAVIEHYIPELIGIFSKEILDEGLPENREF